VESCTVTSPECTWKQIKHQRGYELLCSLQHIHVANETTNVQALNLTDRVRVAVGKEIAMERLATKNYSLGSEVPCRVSTNKTRILVTDCKAEKFKIVRVFCEVIIPVVAIAFLIMAGVFAHFNKEHANNQRKETEMRRKQVGARVGFQPLPASYIPETVV
jgi:hypothetical protein